MNTSKIRFVLLIVLAVVFFSLGSILHIDQEKIQSIVANAPPGLAGGAFVILYVGLTTFIWWGAKDVLRLSSVILFGPYESTVLVFAAEMINAAILFSLSRKLGRGFFKSKIKGRMQELDEVLASTSFARIFFLRLFPILPMRFLDLGFGLTGVSLKKYWTICLTATLPRIFIVQFFYSLGIEVVTNPERLAEYLLAHPAALWTGLAYTAGSFVLLAVLRRKYKKV